MDPLVLLEKKSGSARIDTKFFCVITFCSVMKRLYPDGSGPFQDDNAPIYRVTEWFDECEKGESYTLVFADLLYTWENSYMGRNTPQFLKNWDCPPQ